MKNFKWYVGMTVVAIVIFGSVIGLKSLQVIEKVEAMKGQERPASPVVEYVVESQPWINHFSTIGYIQPKQGVELSIASSGIVDQVNFRSGQKVTKGDVLLTLDSDVERANLAAVRAQLPAAIQRLNRSTELLKKKSLSQQSFDIDQADVERLKAQAAALEAGIKRRTIIAPFDGVLGLRNVDVGQYLKSGDVITVLENVSSMRVRFSVSQKQFSSVKVGLPVQVSTDVYPGKIFSGRITAIEPVIDQSSGVVMVQANIPNIEGKLRSGMYADIDVIENETSGNIVIPNEAISFSLYGESVFIITESEGTLVVHERSVAVAQRRGSSSLIAEGLAIGERLVQSGQVRLSDGSAVRLVKEDFINNSQPLPRS